MSRRGRFPALRELYSGALNRFTPNPDLVPETLVAAEAGVTARVGRGTANVVGFRHALGDAVVRILLEDGTFMRVNRDELTSTGLEFLFDQEIGPIRVEVDGTYQDVELTDPRSQAVRRPENLPELFAGGRVGFPLPWGVGGFVEVRYTGSQFCIDPGTGQDAELEDGMILGGHLVRAWKGGSRVPRIETRLSVENAFDTALYDQYGLPRPGRWVRFEMRLELF